MLLSIDPDGSATIHQQVRDGIVPIYQQIRNRIVEAIAAGELSAGSGLPTARQLAVDLGINFHTVNKAYDLLRREGLLRIGRKVGTVVQRDAAGGPPRPGWERDWAGRLRTLQAEAAAQGLPADGIIRHCLWGSETSPAQLTSSYACGHLGSGSRRSWDAAWPCLSDCHTSCSLGLRAG